MLQRIRLKPTVLVTDAGRGSAVSIIRSLGRKGWRVVAADATRRSLGFHSRYADERLVYPRPETAPDAFAETMFDAACSLGVDLIIPVTDAAILPLARVRERFEPICKLAMPQADALAAASDKLQTFELARRLGVPVPGTRLAETADEAVAFAPELGWPVVLKPQASRLLRDDGSIDSFAVSYARNADELAATMRRFEGRCPVLLQEYYVGAGHGVELLMHEGRPLAAFQHERLREVPLNGGPSALRRSVALDPAGYDYSVRLLRDLRWTGLAMVEFKIGSEGPKLMEINGRVWGSLPLAVHAGMDFPARLAEMWLHGAPEEAAPSTDYAVGVRARNLELELMWIVSVLAGRNRYPFLPIPRRREAFSALASLLNPAYKFDILSLRDPWPGVAEIFKIIGKFAGKIRSGNKR